MRDDASDTGSGWRRCSSCKKPIPFQATYWVCNVSTCNRKRTGLVFCEVSCWDAHLPLMRHRESWAEERTAPSAAEWQRQLEAQRAEAERLESASSAAPAKAKPSIQQESAASSSRAAQAKPQTIIRRARGESSTSSPSSTSLPAGAPRVPKSDEILVVASKLKQYIRDESGFSTSDRVLAVLSDYLRSICEDGIRNARAAERQTVMGRDIPERTSLDRR